MIEAACSRLLHCTDAEEKFDSSDSLMFSLARFFSLSSTPAIRSMTSVVLLALGSTDLKRLLKLDFRCSVAWSNERGISFAVLSQAAATPKRS